MKRRKFLNRLLGLVPVILLGGTGFALAKGWAGAPVKKVYGTGTWMEPIGKIEYINPMQGETTYAPLSD